MAATIAVPLDEQVRRYESEGKVTKYESWEFLSAVLDSNRTCRGICAMDLRSMEVRTFPADAIIMATGGVLDPGTRGLDQHFTDEEMKAICDMAHFMGLKVAAHAHGARGIDAAVRAGVDSIEHGTFIDDQGVKDMKVRGTYYVATLMAFSGVAGAALARQ